jgi:hypothetical protein
MRFRLVRPRFLVFLAVATASLAAPAVGSAAERLVAVDEANRLVVFSSDTPRAITRVRVTGLGAGERLLGLDVRPANGQLVAVSSSSRLYALDAGTGAATAIGQAPFSPAVSGGAFGFDFNPTVDRIRLTSDGRQNLRLHPDTGAVAAVDAMLSYGTSDAGNGAVPQVVASAYTNSVRGATTTQLYDIDLARDVLVLQNPPNNGTLVTVGPLGVDAQSGGGFDIAPSDGTGWAALRVPGQGGSQLYRINLATGAATLVDRIGGGVAVNGLAALGAAQPDTAAPALSIVKLGSTAGASSLAGRPGFPVRAACSEACTLTAQLLLGSRIVGTATTTTELAGSVSLRLRLSAPGAAALRARRTAGLVLSVSAIDAAGNPARPVRRTLRARR